MARRLIMVENRMKMQSKETPWEKYLRLNELARHRKRCQNMKCSIDDLPPMQSPRQRMNRERSDLEQGGASNWIGECKPSVEKLSDFMPWSVPRVARDNPAPFSSLKIQRQDDKMRIHEKSLMVHKERIRKIQKGLSMYSPKKKNYLSRGECPWNYKPPEVHTADEKLKEIRKWAMRHRAKTVPATATPTGILAYLPAIFSARAPKPEPDQPISLVTDGDAAKSPQLAQLKHVQEAGDPNF